MRLELIHPGDEHDMVIGDALPLSGQVGLYGEMEFDGEDKNLYVLFDDTPAGIANALEAVAGALRRAGHVTKDTVTNPMVVAVQ